MVIASLILMSIASVGYSDNSSLIARGERARAGHHVEPHHMNGVGHGEAGRRDMERHGFNKGMEAGAVEGGAVNANGTQNPVIIVPQQTQTPQAPH